MADALGEGATKQHQKARNPVCDLCTCDVMQELPTPPKPVLGCGTRAVGIKHRVVDPKLLDEQERRHLPLTFVNVDHASEYFT